MAAVSMAAIPTGVTSATQKGLKQPIKGLSSNNNIKSFPLSKAAFSTRTKKTSSSLRVSASLKERAVAGASTAAASLAAASIMVIPEVANAADSSLTPSLQNFLLSIAAGGFVIAAISGAVIGVANFDPVKRT